MATLFEKLQSEGRISYGEKDGKTILVIKFATEDILYLNELVEIQKEHNFSDIKLIGKNVINIIKDSGFTYGGEPI